MAKLYEIAGEYTQLLEMLEEADELEESVIKDTLEAIDGEFEAKAENIAKMIKTLKGEAKVYEDEKKRLETRQKTLDKRHKWLTEYLYNAMLAIDKTKFKTGLFSFGIQKNGGPQPIQLVEGADVPESFYKKEIDMSKIRESLKAGEELPFAAYGEYGNHLVIR